MKYVEITKSHHRAALEHHENALINLDGYEKRNFTPKLKHAVRMTLHDIIYNHTIYLSEYKSHIIYRVENTFTVGFRYAEIIRMYVPVEHRGKGVASKMIKKIPEKIVVGHTGDDKIANKYIPVGKSFIFRNNMQKGEMI